MWEAVLNSMVVLHRVHAWPFCRLSEEVVRVLISQKKAKLKIVLFSAYGFQLQSTTATEYSTNNNLCSPVSSVVVYDHITAEHLLDTSRASALAL